MQDNPFLHSFAWVYSMSPHSRCSADHLGRIPVTAYLHFAQLWCWMGALTTRNGEEELCRAQVVRWCCSCSPRGSMSSFGCYFGASAVKSEKSSARCLRFALTVLAARLLELQSKGGVEPSRPEPRGRCWGRGERRSGTQVAVGKQRHRVAWDVKFKLDIRRMRGKTKHVKIDFFLMRFQPIQKTEGENGGFDK